MSRIISLKLRVNKERFEAVASRLGYSVSDGIIGRKDLLRPIRIQNDGSLVYDNMDAQQVSELIGEYIADTYGGQVEKHGGEIYVYV